MQLDFDVLSNGNAFVAGCGSKLCGLSFFADVRYLCLWSEYSVRGWTPRLLRPHRRHGKHLNQRVNNSAVNKYILFIFSPFVLARKALFRSITYTEWKPTQLLCHVFPKVGLIYGSLVTSQIGQSFWGRLSAWPIDLWLIFRAVLGRPSTNWYLVLCQSNMYQMGRVSPRCMLIINSQIFGRFNKKSVVLIISAFSFFSINNITCFTLGLTNYSQTWSFSVFSRSRILIVYLFWACIVFMVTM